jgi:SAM-dependent methyltransferase
MSENERIRWNARYRERGLSTVEPASFLLSLDPLLPRQGRALDVAGGAGRHAIWLATRGLDVTLVDISEVGVALAAAQAAEVGVSLHTIVSDLESNPLPAGPWHVIVDFHYLYRPLFAHFARELAPGGYLVFCQPTMSNLQRHSRPGADFLLGDGELPGLISDLEAPGLEIIDYREGWLSEGRHEACLVARRPAG